MLAALGSGCDPGGGEGSVVVDFTVGDCPPGDDNDNLDGYRYEAGFLGTRRFMDSLSVEIFEHRSLPEETDGLTIRLNLAELLEAGHVRPGPKERWVLTESPLALPVLFTGEGEAASAALSMFDTCPDFPTVYAVDGTLTLTELRIAEDPAGTGRDERIAGSLTATVARGAPLEPVGALDATFELDVPRRPLMTFE